MWLFPIKAPRNNKFALAVFFTGFRYSNCIICNLIVLSAAIKFLTDDVDFGI